VVEFRVVEDTELFQRLAFTGLLAPGVALRHSKDAVEHSTENDPGDGRLLLGDRIRNRDRSQAESSGRTLTERSAITPLKPSSRLSRLCGGLPRGADREKKKTGVSGKCQVTDFASLGRGFFLEM
jgi:hypothetical protein